MGPRELILRPFEVVLTIGWMSFRDRKSKLERKQLLNVQVFRKILRTFTSILMGHDTTFPRQAQLTNPNSPQHGRRRIHPLRTHRPRNLRLWHLRLRHPRTRQRTRSRSTRPRRPLRQQALRHRLHGHHGGRNPPNRTPTHVRKLERPLPPRCAFYPHRRHRRHHRRRDLPHRGQKPNRRAKLRLLHCLPERHEPCLCIRRSLHVLRTNLGDETSRACHACGVCAARVCNRLLRLL